MGLNKELALTALDYITAHPEEHNQKSWATRLACGTAGCLAYHVCHLSGYEADVNRCEGAIQGVPAVSFLTNGDGIESRAMKLLGITSNQAVYLFAFHNSVEKMYDMVNNQDFVNECGDFLPNEDEGEDEDDTND